MAKSTLKAADRHFVTIRAHAAVGNEAAATRYYCEHRISYAKFMKALNEGRDQRRRKQDDK